MLLNCIKKNYKRKDNACKTVWSYCITVGGHTLKMLPGLRRKGLCNFS
jgi:hypothetical protein